MLIKKNVLIFFFYMTTLLYLWRKVNQVIVEIFHLKINYQTFLAAFDLKSSIN